MRFSQYFVALAMALSGAETLTINSDSCLRAVTAVSSKTYAFDCKAHLYTTVTPKKATIYKTKTITTTAQNVNPPFKKRAANAPVIPSYASSACSNSAKYSSACSRTVKTEVVQQTYSTEKIHKVVGTEVKDNIIATQTKTEISTKTEAADPLQMISLIAHDSGDPDLASLGGVGFVHLENQISTGKYFLDFTADVDTDLTFTLNQRTGEIKVVNGPGSSIGKAAYSNVNGNSDNYVRFMSAEEATANAANSVVCKIIPATSYLLGFQCLWRTNQIAEFWTCASRLVLAQPGVDFTSQGTGASTSDNINIEVRLA